MKKILVFAPHADDEIIGVGGTIIKNISSGNEVYICIVTKGTEPVFSKDFVDRIRRETIECHKYLKITKTFFLEFPSAFLEESHRYEINKKISDVIKKVMPDEVYIPHPGDMQKDHRIVSDSCMVALRPNNKPYPSKVFVYEVLSETGWNIPNVQNDFIPNVFVDISDYLDEKLKAMSFYESQLSPFPSARSLETIEHLAKYRGGVMNLNAAEAFFLVREIVE